jgi:hypothetical protein
MADEGKRDIRGFSIGMSAAQLQDNIQKGNWKCYPGNLDHGFRQTRTCSTQEGNLITGNVILVFASLLPEKPLMWVRLNFRTGATLDATIASMSEQYGSKPTWKTENGNRYEFHWQLRDGSDLIYNPPVPGLDSFTLDLVGGSILSQELTAEAALTTARNPPPKF